MLPAFRDNGPFGMIILNRNPRFTLLLVSLLALGCTPAGRLSIRRSRDGQELQNYQLTSATGARDGDRLLSEFVFVSGPNKLTMRMKFLIGVPTRLESGNYQWNQDSVVTQGTVSASSVHFLGGQSGPSSLGGFFQLKSDDVTLYEVRVPPTMLGTPKPATSTDPGVPPFKTR